MNLGRYKNNPFKLLFNYNLEYILWKLKQIYFLYKRNRKIKNIKWVSNKELIIQRKQENPICFGIFIIIKNNNFPMISELVCNEVKSIKEQTYQNFNIFIINKNNLDLNINIDNVIILNDILYEELLKYDYIILMNEYIRLTENAIYEIFKTFKFKNADFIYTDEDTINNGYLFKPDFSPYMLRSFPYMGSCLALSRQCVNELYKYNINIKDLYMVSLFGSEFSKNVFHIPKILYHNCEIYMDISQLEYTLKKFLAYKKINADIKYDINNQRFHVFYKLKEKPLISILIPNKDNIDVLEKCINSLINKTNYDNFEIIILENNSIKQETFDYYKKLQKLYDKIKILVYKHEFNYSSVNNFGVEYSNGEYIILLNNDVEIISNYWIEEMLNIAQNDNVGAVGAKLYFEDNTIQHAGVVLGFNGTTGHIFYGADKNNKVYMNLTNTLRETSIITGALLMVSRKKFLEVQGLDERFSFDFNDMDFCLKLIKLGYFNIFTPYVEAYHYESKSRGNENIKVKSKRFLKEAKLFQKKWKKELLEGDCYYNPNLKLKNLKY